MLSIHNNLIVLKTDIFKLLNSIDMLSTVWLCDFFLKFVWLNKVKYALYYKMYHISYHGFVNTSGKNK